MKMIKNQIRKQKPKNNLKIRIENKKNMKEKKYKFKN